MTRITYSNGGLESLDIVAPLWSKLNEHHRVRSKNFEDYFNRMEWEKRKTVLAEKANEGSILVDIARDNGVVIGYCISSVVGERGEIESIYIEKEYRKQRIGNIFVKKALEWMDSYNVTGKFVSVAAGNEETFGFYQKNGLYPWSTILKQK